MCVSLFVFVYLRVRVCDCTYILINRKAKQMSHNGPTCGEMVSMEGGVAVAALAACLCQLLLRVICKLIQLKAAYPYVCVCGVGGLNIFQQILLPTFRRAEQTDCNSSSRRRMERGLVRPKRTCLKFHKPHTHMHTHAGICNECLCVRAGLCLCVSFMD